MVKINSLSVDDDANVNTEHKHLRTPQAMDVNKDMNTTKKRLINEPMLL